MKNNECQSTGRGLLSASAAVATAASMAVAAAGITMLSTSAHAQASSTTNSTLVWTDLTGFQNASSCVISAGESHTNQRFEALAHKVVEISNTAPDLRLGSSPHSIVSSFWQVVSENGRLLTQRCKVGSTELEYVFFDVTVPQRFDPVARVGVAAEETSILRNIEVHSIENAERIMADRTAALNLAPTGLPVTVGTVTSNSVQSVLTDGLTALEGSLDYVVCVASSRLNVRDESLDRVLFTAERLDSIVPVQSFGVDEKKKTIGGVTYNFIRVQFPERSSDANIGWVADDYVRTRAQCVGTDDGGGGPIATPTPPSESGWVFPTLKRPTDSYTSGMRRFKESRGGGRRYHAAADLYRVVNEAALAVNTGTVIRDRYYFYEGTYAIEVRHSDGKVVRYGEITGQAAPGVGTSKTVNTGQTVGYIGKVNSGCCSPMLHFEMYSGTKSGGLTQSGNKFQRRSDLLDPTSYLQIWERSKFGASY